MKSANRRSKLYLMSAEVMGEPSSHFRPSLRVNVQVLPLSVVLPVSVARSPTSVRVPSALRL